MCTEPGKNTHFPMHLHDYCVHDYSVSQTTEAKMTGKFLSILKIQMTIHTTMNGPLQWYSGFWSSFPLNPEEGGSIAHYVIIFPSHRKLS